jgi:hypothetical protein
MDLLACKASEPSIALTLRNIDALYGISIPPQVLIIFLNFYAATSLTEGEIVGVDRGKEVVDLTNRG